MRPLALLLVLGLVLAAVPAAAQAPTYSQAYQLRGAVGDIPTTNGTEAPGWWNLEQRLTVQFSNSSQAQHAFQVPAGASVVNATCTPCNPTQATVTAESVLFTIGPEQPSGTYTFTVLTRQTMDDAIAFALAAPIGADSPADRVAILYVPPDSEVLAPIEGSSPGLSTAGTARIVQFTGLPNPFWVAIHPETAGVAPDSGDRFDDDLVWVFLALGLVAGAILWALLVSRGVVQKKSRKQVAATAAHVEAAAAEPAPVLEGRKRALLAALKEIEVARMNNEIAPEVYDTLKAELKKEAVTVMRALETNPANPPN